MPRARLRTAEGTTAEWRSELVPRYQRRSERVDEAILGVYLSGTKRGDQRGVGAAAAWRAALEGRGLAPGRPARRRFRDVAAPRSGRGPIQYLLMDGWYPKSALASGGSAPHARSSASGPGCHARRRKHLLRRHTRARRGSSGSSRSAPRPGCPRTSRRGVASATGWRAAGASSTRRSERAPPSRYTQALETSSRPPHV